MILNKFFEEAYFEINGYDMDQIKKEKALKYEKERSDTIIFKKNTKAIITVFGILMIAVAILSSYYDYKTSDISNMIKNIILFIIELVTLILLWQKNKKAEIFSIVGMALIVFMNFIVPKI